MKDKTDNAERLGNFFACIGIFIAIAAAIFLG